MKQLGLAACLVTAGCAANPQFSEKSDRAVLDRVADTCGVDRSVFKQLGGRDLTLILEPDVRYEAVDCLLREIKNSGVPFRLGFIGNEAFANEVN